MTVVKVLVGMTRLVDVVLAGTTIVIDVLVGATKLPDVVYSLVETKTLDSVLVGTTTTLVDVVHSLVLVATTTMVDVLQSLSVVFRLTGEPALSLQVSRFSHA